MKFQVHTPESAPEKSQPVLANIQKAYGFIPNLAAVLAESPGTFGYLSAAMGALESEDMLLNGIERQVVLVAVSVANECAYCTAAHSMLAANAGLSRDDIDAIQDSQSVSDKKLEALRQLATHVVEANGWVEPKMLEAFENAGYGSAHVLEVIAAVSLKTLTNYANHVAKPPVNEQFADFLPKWEAKVA